jgi:hypothetical protein
MLRDTIPSTVCSGFLILLVLADIAAAQSSPQTTGPTAYRLVAQAQQNIDAPTRPWEPFPRLTTSHTIHGSVRGSAANQDVDNCIRSCLDNLSITSQPDLELFGYVQQGVTFNSESPSDRTNGPVLPNYRANDYQFNGLYFVSQRKIDPDHDRIQLGGRADLLYGTDGTFNLSDGLDQDISSGERFYKLALPQLYGNFYLPVGRGVSFKFGKFFTPVGNEVKYNPNNFFYSYYLTFNLQPGNHTGVLGETELTDSLHLRFGPNFGWNTSEGSNDAISYAGDLRYQSTDKRSELTFAFQTGRQQTRIVTTDANVTVYSLTLKQDVNRYWQIMVEHDLLVSDSRVGVSADDFEAYSLVGYMFRTINEQLSAGVRAEWLRDDDGFVTPHESISPSAPGSFYEVTFGLNWRPKAHIRVRPEIRYDHQSRDDRSQPTAFDDGNSADQWLFSCDAIWEY